MRLPILPLILSLLSSCAPAQEEKSVREISEKVFPLAVSQFQELDSQVPLDRFPRTTDGRDSLITSDVGWWTSGFFAGSLWLVYEKTGDQRIFEAAERYTHSMYPLLIQDTDHDIGFQLMCSFGNAYRATGDSKYLPPIQRGARKLAERFNPTVGAIRSWNGDTWSYPVIIDNMMNLEILTFASRILGWDTGDYLKNVACHHALTTMKNHFRDDYSTFHLVDYDPSNGEVLRRQTVQGYSDASSWARGQAWALYGYTMLAREMGISPSPADKDYGTIFLRQAENIARMLLSRLPDNGIPPWDFDAPADGDQTPLVDASAAAIMASAFAELSELSSDNKLSGKCRNMSVTQVESLSSDIYLAPEGTNCGFLLRHGVGNLPSSSEVDVPLTYADYYFLEAILRLEKIERKRHE